MLKRILILFMLALAFWGCGDSALNIKIRYDQIQGLKEGDRLIFEHNHIGKVTGVSYSVDGYYVADLQIKNHFANAATENSKFFIIADLRNKGSKAIQMIQTGRGGTPLQDGAIVEGSTKFLAIFSKISADFEKGLEDLKKQFEQFFEDLRRVPESEEFKKLEKELERLAEEMKRSGKLAREKIRKELLPQLEEAIEKLRERLRKLGREEELEPLEIQIEKIREI
ncbi:MAG: hypothetical protein KAV83_08105 [Desulfobacterales bacterium]|nr:hypothetical protein [Desulfobacterales bacterium]